MTNNLWGDNLVQPLVEKYIKGTDLLYDALLLPYDIKATIAHIKMLEKLHILTKNELTMLLLALEGISKKVNNTEFCIPKEFEDGHSYLETMLIQTCGDTGKKVHFLRSRNDQSLVMLRLFMKSQTTTLLHITKSLIAILKVQAGNNELLPMPGYTHMQKAMPTSVGTWLGAYYEAVIDAVKQVELVATTIDQNPLGSGAGFGFSGQKIQPDTMQTTKLLSFDKPQTNPMYSGMSRGNFEIMLLQAIHPLMLFCSQFASDMLLYAMAEFQFASLPTNFTTGSSIMPQKHNYDVLEIMRGAESIFWGCIEQIHGVVAKKTSGYQRDLQLTKKPFIEAMLLAIESLEVWQLVTKNLHFNKKILEKALTPELYATARANDLTASGMSFRDAYIKVKQEMENKL